jgi:LemA protein
MVAVENYPQLKASENFMHLQRTMNEVEEQISAARRAYNAAVTDYNNAVEMFPTNIMAGMMSYRTKKVFEIPEEQRRDIDTEALFKK